MLLRIRYDGNLVERQGEREWRGAESIDTIWKQAKSIGWRLITEIKLPVDVLVWSATGGLAVNKGLDLAFDRLGLVLEGLPASNRSLIVDDACKFSGIQ